MVKPKTIKVKYSGGPNLNGKLGQRRGQEHQPEDGQGSGNKRAKSGNAQGRARSSLAGHLVAVQTGDDGCRFSGNIDQDRSRRPAIHGPVINSGQHDDGGFGSGFESRGKEQGHGPHGPDARQYPDEGSDEDPDETIKKVDRL